MSNDNSNFEFEENVKCKVCFEPNTEENKLVAPCKCKGSMKFIHSMCLFEWIKSVENPKCEICNHKYVFKKIYAENMPRKVPIYLMLKEALKEMWMVAIFLFKIFAIVARLVIIFGLNVLTVGSDDLYVAILASGFLILANIMHLSLHKAIKKQIKKYFVGFKNMPFRLNASQTLDDVTSTSTATSVAVYTGQQQDSDETESETDSVSEAELIAVHASDVFHRPLSIKNNKYIFLSTCLFASVILTVQQFMRVFAGKFKKVGEIFEMICQKTKLNQFVGYGIYKEYVEFLKAQQIYSFTKGYAILLLLFTIVTGVTYILKIFTSNFKWKEPFLYCKVYLVSSISSVFLFCAQGTFLVFYFYRKNGVSYSNGNFDQGFCAAYNVIFFACLGLFLFFTVKCIKNRFVKELRKGLYRNGSYDNNDKMVIRAIRTSIFMSIVFSAETLFFVFSVTAFICSRLNVYQYSNNLEIFINALSAFLIFTNRGNIEQYLYGLYITLLKGISYLFGLDNYLFGKKMVKFDKNKLCWASNKYKEQKQKEYQANKYKSITLNIEEEEDEESNEDLVRITHDDSQLGFNKDNKDSKNTKENNLKNKSNPREEHLRAKYQINKRRFVKYFGRNHRKSLTIVYKPMCTPAVLHLFKLLCILLTKMHLDVICWISDWCAGNAMDFVERFISVQQFPVDLHKLISRVCFVACVVFIADIKTAVSRFVVGAFVTFLLPLAVSVLQIACEKRLTIFTNAFIRNSVIMNLGCFFGEFFVLTPSLLGRMGRLLFFSLSMNMMFLLGHTSNLMPLYVWCFKCVFYTYLFKKFANCVHNILTGKFVARLRDQHYLEERVVINYEEEAITKDDQ